MSKAPTGPGGAPRVRERIAAAAWNRPIGIIWKSTGSPQRVASALEALVRRRHVPALVVVAPPRTLADLRRDFHADVKKLIMAEVGKDLTKHPVAEIETHLLS